MAPFGRASLFEAFHAKPARDLSEAFRHAVERKARVRRHATSGELLSLVRRRVSRSGSIEKLTTPQAGSWLDVSSSTISMGRSAPLVGQDFGYHKSPTPSVETFW